MFPYLEIGPLSIQSRGVILILGLWLALTLCDQLLKRARRTDIQGEVIFNLAITGLIAGLIGARLAYAARNPAAFAAQPLALILPSGQMLDEEAGLLFGILAALIYGQRKKLPLWTTLDVLTPGLALMAIVIPLANLASGSGYGAPTTLPWGIRLWNEMRHPSQVYEMLAGAITLALVWPRGGKQPAGQQFLRLMAWSAGWRLFLETWRGDSVMLTGSIRLWQVVAWLGLALSLWLLGWLRRQSVEENTASPGE
ncbi:MAG TPA: prolipoprotein diacylglyceryl transferase [Anaerolineaceae bacterium]|nr:prolipoprotein diacylglyceryl transferase [Anaerolineaceae bacterium]